MALDGRRTTDRRPGPVSPAARRIPALRPVARRVPGRVHNGRRGRRPGRDPAGPRRVGRRHRGGPAARLGRAMTARRLVRLVVSLLATVPLMLGVRPAFAGDGSVPFKASYSGSAAFISQTTVQFKGSGNATHMGRITNLGTVNLTGPDASCDGGVANVNTELLTDEHGDTLTIVSQDVSCPTG